MNRERWHDEDTETARLLKRVLADILCERRLKINEAAGRLNISAERAYKYLNEGSLNNNLPAYLVPIFTRMIGPELLHQLAAEAGYAAVALPAEQPSMAEALLAAGEAMREGGEAVQAFISAVEDGKVVEQEWRTLSREVREAVVALLMLLHIAEGMRP